MAPSGVNDTIREVMAAVARFHEDTQGGLVTGGTSNAYTLTSNTTHAALGDQSLLVFRADRANTGAATLNVDALGAKAIEINGAALVSGSLVADSIYVVAYNSTNDAYDLLSPPGLLDDVVYDTRTITAGTGLTGGGDLSANRTVNVGAGDGITVNADDVALAATTAGDGLTYTAGVLDVVGGDGITANANDVALTSTVAGSGLAYSSGVINVGAGTGISVASETVSMALTGGTGIDITGADLSVDLNECPTETTLDQNNDHVVIIDLSDSNATKKMTIPNFELGLTGSKMYYKATNETVTSSTTMQDDNDLASIPLEKTTWYAIETHLAYYQQGGNIKLQFVFSNAPNADDGCYHVIAHTDADLYIGQQALTTEAAFTGITSSGSSNVIQLHGYIQSNFTTGGTFKLQWAQETSSGNGTLMRAGSWIRLQKMS